MRTLLISDTHFGNHPDFADYSTGYNSRFVLQLRAFREALKWGLKQKCDEVMHLGDVFHQRGYIEPEIFNPVKEMLEEYTSSKGYSSIMILSGNHDITIEEPNFNTAIMLRSPGKIYVYDKPVCGNNMVFVPFTKRNFEEVLSEMDADFSKRTLFMHQSIFGAEYGRPILKGVHPKLLKLFKRVYCGHIHQPQNIGHNIHIIGAPYQINFGDTGERCVYILEDYMLVDRLMLKHPCFITQRVKDGRIPPTTDNFNFYRYISDRPIQDVPTNARVVTETVNKKIVRVRAKTDSALIKAYCTRMKKPEMYELGMKLLTERLPEHGT